jgi:hypothetical protein
VRHQQSWNHDEVTLGPGEYFVMGDNRRASDNGVVDADRIAGRLMF